jgi:hypothetical protein
VLFFSLSFSRAPFSSLFFFFKCWFLQFCIKYFTFWYFLVFVFDKYLCFLKKNYMKINQ